MVKLTKLTSKPTKPINYAADITAISNPIYINS